MQLLELCYCCPRQTPVRRGAAPGMQWGDFLNNPGAGTAGAAPSGLGRGDPRRLGGGDRDTAPAGTAPPRPGRLTAAAAQHGCPRWQRRSGKPTRGGAGSVAGGRLPARMALPGWVSLALPAGAAAARLRGAAGAGMAALRPRLLRCPAAAAGPYFRAAPAEGRPRRRHILRGGAGAASRGSACGDRPPAGQTGKRRRGAAERGLCLGSAEAVVCTNPAPQNLWQKPSAWEQQGAANPDRQGLS